jgi:hypothetical protein
MERNTGTIFKVYLLKKSSPDKQEGFIELWKHKGELQRMSSMAFDYWDELPKKMRALIRRAKIDSK